MKPSEYAATVLDPLAQLVATARKGSVPIAEDKISAWSGQVCKSVFSKATEICAELVVSAHQTAAMLSKMGGDSSTAEKTEPQLFVEQLTADVAAIGAQAQTLGINTTTSAEYQRLLKCLRVM